MKWLRCPFIAVAEAIVLVLILITMASVIGMLVNGWVFLDTFLTLIMTVFVAPSPEAWGGRIVFLMLVAVTYYVEPDARG